ncbi:MAG: S41 family peptidase, partial [Bacteroidota bacterium]|nr:S41 family peptidase [Bacteroidota bacterium]
MKKVFIFIALLVSVVGNLSCKKVLFHEEPSNDPQGVFQSLWEDFQKHYAVFEERGVNWEVLYSQYHPKITAGTSEEELYGIVTEMLSKLNDAHVNLTTPNRPVFNANRILNKKIDDDLFNLSVIKDNYLKNKFTEGEASVYVYGLIDNIIYVHFRGINASFSILPKILQSYSEAKGLIVDLRHNPGGDFTYSFPELG